MKNIQLHLALFSRIPAWLMITGIVLLSVPGPLTNASRLIIALGLALFLLHPERRLAYLTVGPLLLIAMLSIFIPPLPLYSINSGIVRLAVAMTIWLCLILAVTAITRQATRIIQARQKESKLSKTPPIY